MKNIKEILVHTEPKTEIIIQCIEAEMLRDGLTTKLTESQKVDVRVIVTQKLVNALTNYIKDTDQVSQIEISEYIGGDGYSLTIEMKVTRDGQVYDFQTVSNLVGGYNIVKLHPRYTVKTKLPKIDNKETMKVVNELSKYMRKDTKSHSELSKVNYEISYLKKKIEEAKYVEYYTEKNVLGFSTDYETALTKSFGSNRILLASAIGIKDPKDTDYKKEFDAYVSKKVNMASKRLNKQIENMNVKIQKFENQKAEIEKLIEQKQKEYKNLISK